MNELYIGVMSGTSMDSVDVALCSINKERCSMIASLEYPYNKELRDDILDALKEQISLQKIGQIDHRLGVLFSNSINALLKQNSINRDDINAVGLHGQTLWHEPNGKYPFSMQLGDANLVATKSGIKVVADFRRKDIALQGQGAPLVPPFHNFLFSRLGDRVALLNIGGISNITLLGDTSIGYDTGPGNTLLDGWAQRHLNRAYDFNGEWAQGGKVDKALLSALKSESYFSRAAPKSTGREEFNIEWLEGKLQNFLDISAQNIQATLLAFTVSTVADEVRAHKIEHLLVCGGGVENSHLMHSLESELSGIEVSSTYSYGVDASFLEAMAFAWLAYKRINREEIDIKGATGAQQNSLLGVIYE